MFSYYDEKTKTVKKQYFKRVFESNATLKEIFNQCQIPSLLDKAIEGSSESVVTYGGTRPGKAYTMQGPNNVTSKTTIEWYNATIYRSHIQKTTTTKTIHH